MQEHDNQERKPEEQVLDEMRMQGLLTFETLYKDVPQNLLDQFADRLKEVLVDQENPIVKSNTFRSRAIERLYEVRNRILALQNPQEYFHVPEYLEKRLQEIGFKLVVNSIGNEEISVSIQEKDAGGDWHETAAGNVALPTLDSPIGSTWELDMKGSRKVHHDIVALWRSLWGNNVHNFGNANKGPEKAARENIEELKAMLLPR